MIQNRHFPIGRHLFAHDAAIASECASLQGRGSEMHLSLFAAQDSLGEIPWPTLAARAGGIDNASFTRCLAEETPLHVVTRDSTMGRQLRIEGTPTMLINQQRMMGVPSLEELKRLIEVARTTQIAR